MQNKFYFGWFLSRWMVLVPFFFFLFMFLFFFFCYFLFSIFFFVAGCWSHQNVCFFVCILQNKKRKTWVLWYMNKLIVFNAVVVAVAVTHFFVCLLLLDNFNLLIILFDFSLDNYFEWIRLVLSIYNLSKVVDFN